MGKQQGPPHRANTDRLGDSEATDKLLGAGAYTQGWRYEKRGKDYYFLKPGGAPFAKEDGRPLGLRAARAAMAEQGITREPVPGKDEALVEAAELFFKLAQKPIEAIGRRPSKADAVRVWKRTLAALWRKIKPRGAPPRRFSAAFWAAVRCMTPKETVAWSEEFVEAVMNDNIGEFVESLRNLQQVFLARLAADLHERLDDDGNVAGGFARRAATRSGPKPRKFEVKMRTASRGSTTDKHEREGTTYVYDQQYINVGMRTTSKEQTVELSTGAIEGILLLVLWEELLRIDIMWLPTAWLNKRKHADGELRRWNLTGPKSSGAPIPSPAQFRSDWLAKYVVEDAVFVRSFRT